jgi:hypothetical protein
MKLWSSVEACSTPQNSAWHHIIEDHNVNSKYSVVLQMLILRLGAYVNCDLFDLFSEDNNTSLSDTIKVGAFADSCRQPQSPLEPDLEMPNVPFSSLLTPRQQSPPQPSEPAAETDDDGNGNVTPHCDSRRSSCSMVSCHDDFIMVDLVIICSDSS